jgi:hypothetical protein
VRLNPLRFAQQQQLQLLFEAQALGQRPLQDRRRLVADVLSQRLDDRLLAREVAVEGGGAEPGLLGDLWTEAPANLLRANTRAAAFKMWRRVRSISCCRRFGLAMASFLTRPLGYLNERSERAREEIQRCQQVVRRMCFLADRSCGDVVGRRDGAAGQVPKLAGEALIRGEESA